MAVAARFQTRRAGRKPASHSGLPPRVRTRPAGFLSWFFERSGLAFVQPVDEATGHLGDFFKSLAKFLVPGPLDEPAPPSDFQQRHTLLGRSPGNGKEFLRSGLVNRPLPSARFVA